MKHIMIMLSMCFAMFLGFQLTTPSVDVHTPSVREVTVEYGDTVWDIASRHTQANMDVREVVYAVKELNQINDSGSLVPGTKIKIPVQQMVSPVRAMDYMAQN